MCCVTFQIQNLKNYFQNLFKIEKRKISKWIQTIKIYFQHLKCTWLFLSPILPNNFIKRKNHKRTATAAGVTAH